MLVRLLPQFSRPTQRPSWRHKIAGCCALAVFAWAWIAHPTPSPTPFHIQSSDSVPTQAIHDSHFIGSGRKDFVHSASIAALPDNDLFATWFAGTREGHRDVVIKLARYSHAQQQWGPASDLITRTETGIPHWRRIRKLGNPVIALDPFRQRLWVFYVSVSVGGWAGSAINSMYSDDLGDTWSAPRRLITSPFLNFSTLVRTNPVFHANGDIGLPVYHEFLGKFSEYLILDQSGTIQSKHRISKGRDTLQPAIVPVGDQSAVAFLRWGQSKPGLVMTSQTFDGGHSWTRPQTAPVSNPNSSLAAIGLNNEGNDILVAVNDTGDGRHRLSLFKVDPQLQDWRPVTIVDQSPTPDGEPVSMDRYQSFLSNDSIGPHSTTDSERLATFSSHLDQRMCSEQGCVFEYEYPQFTRDDSGTVHLVYSWNNSLIKHLKFNTSWLNQLEGSI